MLSNPYEQNLDKSPANFQALTPLSFLERTATTTPNHTAIVHGNSRFTYAEFYARARRLGSALAMRYIGPGDTVSVMLANTPPMLEAHFGVAMTGAVLHTINTRLDAAIIAFQLDHANTKVLITDREFSATMKDALSRCRVKPFIIDYNDPEFPQTGDALSYDDYEAFIAKGDPNFKWRWPGDEWDSISLNYTSGTTGNPKGVVYHHRGAALMCYANTIATGMTRHPVYLWTLPMFHCNGWCATWGVTAHGAAHICMRKADPENAWRLDREQSVTHFAGAPIVMIGLLNHASRPQRLVRAITVTTGGAPPSPTLVEHMEEIGARMIHIYGLTETYGPYTICAPQQHWRSLFHDERAKLMARQGVRFVMADGLRVVDESMCDVPADGKTMGEVVMRGNIVMKGYYNEPEATAEAFRGGWFHSGDLAVLHPDGYIELRDRSKDIIISGGENISSIEVEGVLLRHPAVAGSAVVAKPDEKWGETPCAFVELRSGANASAEELLEWCRAGLARYKVPRHLVFAEVPKTSTGKIQKFKLREMAKEA